ncbi:MAG: GntR family transcriptional regulator [Fibrobacter sp.]|nr:GntR family transcriptional regulator [Fibrobacter sp.]
MKDRIIRQLLNTPHKDGDRLPSVRSMIEAYGASSGTVQAVLKTLAESSMICKIQGKGCFWGKDPTLTAVPEIRLSTMEKLNRDFDQDFKQGFLKPSTPLPQGKELSARYNVSQNTLRKFLENKVNQGLLAKQGRQYFFYNRRKAENKENLSELIFVTRCNSWGGFTAESERELDFLRLVYKTAGANRYKLTLFGINDATGELIDRNGNPCKLSEHPNAVGAILSTLLVQKFHPLLNFFASVKFPVAVWWEHPEENVPRSFLKKPNWTFFNSTFGKKPGVEMGRFLKKNGILEINYISPFHNSSWSKDRLAGLLDAGLTVHAYVDDEFASPWDYKQIARKKVEKHSVEIFARTLIREKLESLTTQAKEDGSILPCVCVNDEVAGILLEMGDNELTEQLIAFDNSMESYLQRIPSFDFNTEALIEHIFYYLSNPSAFGDKKKIHHILGNVVEK